MFLSDEQFNKQYGGGVKKKAFLSDIDFEMKYNPPTKDERNWLERQATGVGKGLVKSFMGFSSLGERALRGTLKILPKKEVKILGIPIPVSEKKFGVEGELEKTAAETLIPEEAITAKEGEKVGFMLEQLAEWLVPIPGLKIAKTAKILKYADKASKLEKVAKIGTKGAISTGEFTGRAAIQEGDTSWKDFSVAAGVVTAGGIVTKLGSKIIKNIPEWFMKKAVKQKADAFLAGTDISKFAVAKQKVGTIKSLMNQSGKEIDKALKTVNGYITKINKLEKELMPLKESIPLISRSKMALLAEDMVKMQKSKKLEGSLDDIIKDAIGFDFKEAAKGANKQAQKMLLNYKKSYITAYKETILREALRSQLSKSQAKHGISPIDLFQIVLSGFGGYHLSGGTITGAIAGTAASKTLPWAAQSPLVLTHAAKATQKILEKLTTKERQLLFEFIKGIISQTTR